eukprot:superscaffoldBa00001795_g12049
MEWKSNLRRTQSLRNIPSSCDKPTWMEAGLRGKQASVSQLVASGPLETKETHLESVMKRNNESERSQPKTNLSRSKSMGSLHNSASIDALKALFESKGATQNKLKSSFRAANVTTPSKAADILPVMNGEVEEVKSSAEKQKTQIPADAPVNDVKPDAKEENASRKVANQTRRERRKTIGGIDFEEVAAYQADEKRRSIADFKDSSFNQTKEQLCVSVKAISALYLSKVAPQKPPHSHLKPEQDQSSESGKRVKVTKMAEDSLQKKDDHLPPTSARHQPGPEDIFGPHSQQLMPSQPSKEMLYQQRQKCELRRLLKHTHPELKMLDEVVDEELAEVLSSESGVAAAETGYEGEVLSRRLIFENCALSNKVSTYIPKLHMAEETAERGNVSKTSAVFEVSEERPHVASVKAIVEADNGSSPDPNRECEEEIVRIDVQATRRMFESQSVNTSKPNPENKFQGKVFISGDETGAVQKRKQGFDMCSKQNLHSKNRGSDTDLTEQNHDQGLSQQFKKRNFLPTKMWADKAQSFIPNSEVIRQRRVHQSGDPNTCGQTADSKDKHEREIKQEGKVEMREKKGRTETEDERRQRLSVHMDEIMRGNITAAMEIFDNLRKQEELQSILSRVEEIEEDTSEVDEWGVVQPVGFQHQDVPQSRVNCANFKPGGTITRSSQGYDTELEGPTSFYHYHLQVCNPANHFNLLLCGGKLTAQPQVAGNHRIAFEGQPANQRPDIIARVFHMKVEALLTGLLKHDILGQVDAYMMNNASHCMVDQKCTKDYPKVLLDKTSFSYNFYPLYRTQAEAASGAPIITAIRGSVNVSVNYALVAPYNPYILIWYDAHINLEIVCAVNHVKYLYKIP